MIDSTACGTPFEPSQNDPGHGVTALVYERCMEQEGVIHGRFHGAHDSPGGVRARFRARFQAVKVPIFDGFPPGSPTNKATAQSSFLKGITVS